MNVAKTALKNCFNKDALFDWTSKDVAINTHSVGLVIGWIDSLRGLG